MKKRIFVLMMIFIVALGMFPADKGIAASVKASLSGGSCKVGKSVTVTLTYSGSTFGAAKASLSYDSSLLELTGKGGAITTVNGNSYLLEDMESSTMTATFTFRAKAAGQASVSVATIEGETLDDGAFSCGTVATTVKISADSGPSGSSGSSGSSGTSGSSGNSGSSSSSSSTSKQPSTTNGRGDFTDTSLGVPEDKDDKKESEEDPSEKPDEIIVTVNDKTFIIVEKLTEKELPEGFSTADSKYGEYEWPVQIAKSEESQYTLILLKNKDTGDEEWFLYDEESGKIRSEISISVSEALEYEKLSAAEKEKNDDKNFNFFIIIAAVLGVFVVCEAGYILYDKIIKQKKHSR